MTLSQRSMAWLALILFTLLIIWGVAAGDSVRERPEEIDPNQSDMYLYMAISDRISNGQSYYEAAIEEQVHRGYPIHPSTTVRTPTSALLISTLGPDAAYVLLVILIATTAFVGIFVFEKLSKTRLQWLVALFFLIGSLAILGPDSIYFHESWAVLLLFLSLIARSKSLLLSIALAFLACMFRELAFPFIVAMATYEFLYRNKRGSIAWLLAGVSFLAIYGIHMDAVSRAIETSQSISTDKGESTSPGWFAFGGWPFVVGSVRSITPLSAMPYWISAFVTPLALLGWLMLKDKVAKRFVFGILAFVLPFLVIGRPNNNYWGLIYAALLLPGFAFSWQGIRNVLQLTFGRTSGVEPTPSGESSRNAESDT